MMKYLLVVDMISTYHRLEIGRVMTGHLKVTLHLIVTHYLMMTGDLIANQIEHHLTVPE